MPSCVDGEKRFDGTLERREKEGKEEGGGAAIIQDTKVNKLLFTLR